MQEQVGRGGAVRGSEGWGWASDHSLRGRTRTGAHQDIECALGALLVLLDGGEDRQHEAGENQQEAAGRGRGCQRPPQRGRGKARRTHAHSAPGTPASTALGFETVPRLSGGHRLPRGHPSMKLILLVCNIPFSAPKRKPPIFQVAPAQGLGHGPASGPHPAGAQKTHRFPRGGTRRPHLTPARVSVQRLRVGSEGTKHTVWGSWTGARTPHPSRVLLPPWTCQGERPQWGGCCVVRHEPCPPATSSQTSCRHTQPPDVRASAGSRGISGSPAPRSPKMGNRVQRHTTLPGAWLVRALPARTPLWSRGTDSR